MPGKGDDRRNPEHDDQVRSARHATNATERPPRPSTGVRMNPVHQYEPHDAPDPMTRDFYVGAVIVGVCLIGAAAIVLAACCAVGRGLERVAMMGGR